MANPLLTAARQVLRDPRTGRFISKKAAELARRRDPITGRFISKIAAARRPDPLRLESFLRNQLGAPPAGLNWVTIAAKYTDRFEDFLADFQ